MPKANNIRERLQQVAAWLSDEFPAQYPVEVRWVSALPDGSFGESYREQRRFVIRLSWRRLRRDRAIAIETLMHEHAHCSTWLPHRDDEHPIEFYGELKRINDAWEAVGELESIAYPIKRVRLR